VRSIIFESPEIRRTHGGVGGSVSGKEPRTMLPQTPELLQLVSTDRRHREAVAAAERLRDHGGLRDRAAASLRRLADRIAPLPSVPSVDGELAGRYVH
jgi:hypothetical protein